MEIQFLTEEFYSMEAVVALLSQKDSKFEPMRHSHARWFRDFSEFRSQFHAKMASAIFDYTAMVVAGELRHCRKKASRMLENYPHGGERDELYNECTIWDPISILKAGAILFDRKVTWASGYGGIKWQQIAFGGLKRSTLNDIVFIDHCVDLSHNNSVYFDKGAGIFSMSHGNSSYKQFLNFKRDCHPVDLIANSRGRQFNTLMKRAITLGIFNIYISNDNFRQVTRNITEERLFSYEPVKWGGKTLRLSVVPSSYSEEEENRDREYNDDDCDAA